MVRASEYRVYRPSTWRSSNVARRTRASSRGLNSKGNGFFRVGARGIMPQVIAHFSVQIGADCRYHARHVPLGRPSMQRFLILAAALFVPPALAIFGIETDPDKIDAQWMREKLEAVANARDPKERAAAAEWLGGRRDK